MRGCSLSKRERKIEPEWIGGRLSPPFFVEDRAEPYRVTLAVWMEQSSGIIVGQEVCAPEDVEGALGRVLQSALDQPVGAGSRRPVRLRVSDQATAEEVRTAIGNSIPVTVAPTPELDALLNLMVKEMPGPEENASYLEGGRIPPAAVGRLFEAAGALYRVAPWKVATDDQALRLDIPKLDVKGACVVIIGHLGESLGVLVFPSLARYQKFRRAAERPRTTGRIDAGTDWLALSFERGADLPTSQRREVAAHRWPVPDAHAYPVVTRHDRDASMRPLVERDLEIATACARALADFYVKHHRLFDAVMFEPVSESFIGPDGIEVRFTVPYEAFELFDR